MISQLQERDLIEVVESKGFVDNSFLALFIDIRMEQYPLLITQDKNLANDILNLNNTKSVRANLVKVKKINQYGYLSDFVEAINSSDEEKSSNLNSRPSTEVDRRSNSKPPSREPRIRPNRDNTNVAPFSNKGNINVAPFSYEGTKFDYNWMKENYIQTYFTTVENQVLGKENKKIEYPIDKADIKNLNWNIEIDLQSLTESEYEEYCKSYLMEKISEVVPTDIARNITLLIRYIPSDLFEKLDKASNRVLLIAKINSLLKGMGNVQIRVEVLYLAIGNLVNSRYSKKIVELNIDDDILKEEFKLENRIDCKELTQYAYQEYCRLYLAEKIYDIVMQEIEYSSVTTLIAYIDVKLFANLNSEQTRLFLINKINTLFIPLIGRQIPKEKLEMIVDELNKKINN